MRRPNVLFLLSDQHAYRYLSLLGRDEGGEPVRTPTLDSLARGGVYFRNAYCQAPLCVPSRMCLLTGRDQHNCAAWDNGSVMLPGIPTLPGWLADQAGYETCLIGKMHFGGTRQFNGFRHRPYGDIAGDLWMASHQNEPLPSSTGGRFPPRRPLMSSGITTLPESMHQEQVIAREALAFLREHRHRAPDQPWFLCASFSRPHTPWTSPARHFERYWPTGATPPRVGYAGDTSGHPLTVNVRAAHGYDKFSDEEIMLARASYFACVDYLDEVLGDFLASLERAGFLENTIVIYTSDHGEMAGEHGLWSKTVWHEASVRVPFMIQLPEHRDGRLAAGYVVDAPVSLGDLFPTVCGLLGIEPPGGLDGKDLSGAIRSGREPDRGPVFSQMVLERKRHGAGTGWRMVRKGRFKYVAFQGVDDLLFDLESDPDEQVNLASRPEYADVASELRSRAAWETDESGKRIDVFELAVERHERDRELFRQFASRVKAKTANQMILPDGRVVEADIAFYEPSLLTEDPKEAFDDWPY